MSQAAKPVVVVLGATGAQGGNVVDWLLKENKYHIRGVTRKADSPGGKALAAKGVEVVQGNAGDKESMTRAFKGAWAVFAVTNFWDAEIFPKNIGLEEQQGKLMADVAKAEKVQVYLWSSLHDSHTISGGKLEVPHFSGKNRVEQYIKKIGLNAVFMYAGFYASNFGSFFPPQKRADGGYDFSFPLRADVGLPVVDPEDFGYFVSRVLRDPAKFSGKRVLMAGEYLTVPQAVEVLKRLTGIRAEFHRLPMETFAKNVPDEFAQTFKWFNDYGYYNGEDLSENLRDFPAANTFESFIRRTKWAPQ